jgi:hypothetical protein
MAEVWETLKSVRIKLNDPFEVINLNHVTNFAALPASAISQTAYRTDDTGEYYVQSGAYYIKKDLTISDELLNSMIGTYGEYGAIQRAIPILISKTLREMQVARLQNGSESIEYQTLRDVLDFYRSLKDLYKDEGLQEEAYGTGRSIRTKRPIIGAY